MFISALLDVFRGRVTKFYAIGILTKISELFVADSAASFGIGDDT